MSHISYYGEDHDVPTPPREERAAGPMPPPAAPRSVAQIWDRAGVRGALYL